MAYCHVARCIVGNNVIMGNATQPGKWKFYDYYLGGGTLVRNLRVGAHSMSRSGSRFRRILPFITAGRERFLCRINSIGLRRRGFTNKPSVKFRMFTDTFINQG